MQNYSDLGVIGFVNMCYNVAMRYEGKLLDMHKKRELKECDREFTVYKDL